MKLGSSYNLRVVLNWLDEHRIPYVYSSGGLRFSLYETGCRISLNDQYELSIQTDPMIAGNSFAETALLSTVTKGIAYGLCGYGDVKRHDTSADLFKEIEWLMTQEMTEDQ